MSIADKLTTIAENEQKVYDAGYLNGQSYGESTKEEEVYDKIWHMITNGGMRVDFRYAFYHTDYTHFAFTIPIKPTKYVANMFNYYRGSDLPLNIDLSLIPTTTTHGAIFAYSLLFFIDDINIPALNAYHNTFLGCKYLQEIEKIRVHKKSTFFQTFSGCDALANVTFEGEIGRDISFSSCANLTVTTLKHIISSLVNYANTDEDFIYTLALNSASVSKLEKEGITSPNGNTWRQYAVDKGWNIS